MKKSIPKDLFIVAEMSGNHNHSLERALNIVDAAAACGADAIKVQTYTPDSMTLPISGCEFFTINDEASPWHGKSSYAVYKEAALPYAWHKPIFERCKTRGVIGFSTPFDFEGVDFLENLDVPLYKIASAEIIDLPLLSYVGQTRKPVIISTGMANLEEIEEAVETLRKHGCPELALLQCTTSYPALIEDSNLLTIPYMRRRFPRCRVGLSDHTMGIASAVASVALGGSIIEKHFTLSRTDGGVDSLFSMEPDEFAQLTTESRNAAKALGCVYYGPSKSETYSINFRRSLFVVQDIKKGELFSNSNIRSIRPAAGLHPRHYEYVLTKTACIDIKAGTPLSFEMLG